MSEVKKNDIETEKIVKSIVDAFYLKVLLDKNLRGFFQGMNMNRQRQHQTNLILDVLYDRPINDKLLKSVHKDLAITSSHFDQVAAHLSTALKAGGISDEVFNKIVSAFASRKSLVIIQE